MYILYKTTNIINSKYYIGVHKQSKKDFDDYYGSGIALKAAVDKYGEDNFSRKTLFTFDNKKDAYNKEKEIVNLTLINLEECYNCRTGGNGGSDGHSEATKKRMSKSAKKRVGLKHSEATKKKISEATIGRVTSEETKQKLVRARKKRCPVSEETKRKMSLSRHKYLNK